MSVGPRKRKQIRRSRLGKGSQGYVDHRQLWFLGVGGNTKKTKTVAPAGGQIMIWTQITVTRRVVSYGCVDCASHRGAQCRAEGTERQPGTGSHRSRASLT